MMSGTEDDVISFIDNAKKEFKSLPQSKFLFHDRYLMLLNINLPQASTQKETPIHVRGASLV